MTGKRTSSVKTLTDSSGDGDGDGDACGLAGCCGVCAAATAKKAAITRSPVVRLKLNISGIRQIGCLREFYVAFVPLRNLGGFARNQIFHAKGAQVTQGTK